METTEFTHSNLIGPDSVIALGDCHGQVDHFNEFLQWVKGSGARIILLGDLIDRSSSPGADLIILNKVRDLIQDPESWGLESFITLKGNHEVLFLNAVDGYGWEDWVRNGGDWREFENLKEHAEWIRTLPYFITIGETLFTHSGGVYGKNPQDFMESFHLREEFVWSRTTPHRGSGLNKWSKTLTKSVFGHSPRKDGKPYQVGDAICLDSGCYFSGVLTAYNSTQNSIKQFQLK
jgi:hypothetical protein